MANDGTNIEDDKNAGDMMLHIILIITLGFSLIFTYC
jgi:hypothetical protein